MLRSFSEGFGDFRQLSKRLLLFCGDESKSSLFFEDKHVLVDGKSLFPRYGHIRAIMMRGIESFSADANASIRRCGYEKNRLPLEEQYPESDGVFNEIRIF